MSAFLDSIDIQDRDRALLRGLFESRVMTAKHVCSLFFGGKPEATKQRLRKLKNAGFIGERQRRVNDPAILFLTRAGFKFLLQEGSLSGFPILSLPAFDRRASVSDLTLKHELQVMDVKTALHAALANSPRYAVADFSTWPLLYQFSAVHPGRLRANVPVKPDGYLRIHEHEEGTKGYDHDFFVEVDRSSEAQEKLVAKAHSYLDYYNSGGFARRCGGTRDAYKDYPFRVLMVFKTAERRNNTAERLLQNNPPILTQVCLSTFAEVTNDPLGAIWMRPREYRESTESTQFDTERLRNHFSGYRRQAERDSFVEANVRKVRLLEN